LIDAVTGFLPKYASGTVLLDGEDVLGWSPHRIAHAGLTRTWQTLELFDDITVRANLDVAVEQLTFAGAIRDYFRPGRRHDRVDEVLARLDMEHIAERKPRELSQGHRKMVGVARALVAESRVLLLDEPAAGLDKSETIWFGQQIRRLVDDGQTMLLVDHDMSLVLTVCDQIHTVVFGELIASGTPAETRVNPDVIAAYLGASS
jgi:branched-chain amino acid transport system ATP-binding protein